MKGIIQNSHHMVVHKQGTEVFDLSKVPTDLPEKSVWMEQWPLPSEKLQALEHLVQEQLNVQHIEELTSP